MLLCRYFVLLLFVGVVLGEESLRQGISRGTTWCGVGNASSSPDIIEGAYTSIDSCCRIHDMCPATIGAMTSKYGHFNFRMFTISYCECDEEFRSCLKMAGRHGQEDVKEKVRKIGNLFFNNPMASCFRLERVRVCDILGASGECLRYKNERRVRIYSLKSF